MRAINLDGVVMCVSSTDDSGVVDASTRVFFIQKEERVFARYAGGAVTSGCLVGAISGATLTFRYTQLENSGQIHGGRSICEIQASEQAGFRVIEHFTWATRSGSGTNIFDEIR